MGLFSKLFGVDKKIKVIRHLIVMVDADAGLSEQQVSAKLAKLSDLDVLGSPIGGVATNIETISKSQQSGSAMFQILEHIEGQRQRLGVRRQSIWDRLGRDLAEC